MIKIIILFQISHNYTSENYIDVLNRHVLEFVEDNYADDNFYYNQDNSSVQSANFTKIGFDKTSLLEHCCVYHPSLLI